MDKDGNEDNMEQVTAAAVSTIDDDGKAKQLEGRCCTAVYQPKTFRPDSVKSARRHALLPAYPLARNAQRRALLLLPNVANVDREELEKQSYCGGVCLFQFKLYGQVTPINCFMGDFYQSIFVESGRRWNIDYSIIDFNLCRLRTCIEEYTAQTREPAMLSFDEYPMALEFYLQIDGK